MRMWRLRVGDCDMTNEVTTNRLKANLQRLMGIESAKTGDCIICHQRLTHLRDDLWECPVHGIFNLPVCPQIDSCGKIDMIMDKDILESQAADAIRSVCGKCTVGGKA